MARLWVASSLSIDCLSSTTTQRAPPPLEGLASLLADHGVHQVEEGCAHEGGYVAADGSLGGGDQQDAAVMERLAQVDGGAGLAEDGPRPL